MAQSLRMAYEACPCNKYPVHMQEALHLCKADLELRRLKAAPKHKFCTGLLGLNLPDLCM